MRWEPNHLTPIHRQLLDDLPRMLTAEEVAHVLGVPRKRVYALRDGGKLPAIRLGRDYRWDPAELAKFIRTSRFPGGRS